MGKIFTWAIKIYRNSRKYMWEYEQFETWDKEMKVKGWNLPVEREVNERGI